MEATIFDVQRGSYVDGPGIRTTVFLKGCHLNCAWCHNPESKSGEIERLWYANKCTFCGKCMAVCHESAITLSDGRLVCDSHRCKKCGKCELFCPNNAVAICGRQTDVEGLMKIIRRDKDIYDTVGGGVTVSGGECMLHPDFLTELLSACRKEKISTAVDTAGNLPYSYFEQVMPYTDIFLYDIKVVTPELHRRYIGVDNALILENYRRLIQSGARVIVRVPMVAEVNANDAEFAKIADFLKAYPPEATELLPYHAMGENKFRALFGSEPPHFTAPSAEALARYRNFL